MLEMARWGQQWINFPNPADMNAGDGSQVVSKSLSRWRWIQLVAEVSGLSSNWYTLSGGKR